MQSPKRNYTLETLAAMMGFGLLIGLVFPPVVGPFVEWVPGRKIPFALMCLGAGLMVGGVGFVISYLFLIRRVRSMAEVLRETCIREGDLTFRLPVESRDTIGTLSIYFNENIENLQVIIDAVRSAGDRMSRELQDLAAKVVNTKVIVNEFGNGTDNLNGFFTKLNTSMAEILDQITNLSSSAEQTMSTVHEQESNIRGIEEQADKLKESVDETVSSIEELAASNRQVSENASSMNTAASYTTALVDKMNEGSEQVQSFVQEVENLSTQMVEEVKGGTDCVKEVASSISEIDEIGKDLAKEFESLYKDSESIGNIVNVMQEIGDQTNLLALNAAIIAAQSGDEGKSFAVVASEIRELSERTSQSAREVSKILDGIQSGINRVHLSVEESQKGTEKTVSQAEDARKALSTLSDIVGQNQDRMAAIEGVIKEHLESGSEIAQSMNSVKSLSSEIDGATVEQQRGLELINQAAAQLEEVAKRVKNALGEQRDASAQLTEASQFVASLVRQVVDINNKHNGYMNEVKGILTEIHSSVGESNEMVERVDENRTRAQQAMLELESEIGAFQT